MFQYICINIMYVIITKFFVKENNRKYLLMRLLQHHSYCMTKNINLQLVESLMLALSVGEYNDKNRSFALGLQPRSN